MLSHGEGQAETTGSTALDIRTAELTDAATIWRLVEASGALDVNSCYAYLLLCSHFADTCLVACEGEELAGFVAAYVPPRQPEVIFVWQIAVAPRYRGQGLARELLAQLVERARTQGARYLEATITPDNQASQRLFRGLAESRNWPVDTRTHFESRHFAGSSHDPELLFRIGPFQE